MPRQAPLGQLESGATRWGMAVTAAGYVHGYSGSEAVRLGDQADTLAELLHTATGHPAGSRVLEVGCGVGAQTVHLAGASPGAHIVAFDISSHSLAQARARMAGVTASPLGPRLAGWPA